MSVPGASPVSEHEPTVVNEHGGSAGEPKASGRTGRGGASGARDGTKAKVRAFEIFKPHTEARAYSHAFGNVSFCIRVRCD